jgi:hypothetical protein
VYHEDTHVEFVLVDLTVLFGIHVLKGLLNDHAKGFAPRQKVVVIVVGFVVIVGSVEGTACRKKVYRMCIREKETERVKETETVSTWTKCIITYDHSSWS